MALSVQRAVAGLALSVTALGVNVSPANDFSLAAPAQAQATQTVLPSQMRVGQCASRADVLDGLNREGQYILVAGDAEALDAASGQRIFLRQAFTADRGLTSGYHFGQNQAGSFCKSADLSNIKLLEARKDKIDARVYLPPVERRSQGTLNASIEAGFASVRSLPMFQATSHNGKIITVTANINDGNGALLFANPNGKLSDTIFGTVNTKYSSVALEHLSSTRR